MSWSSFACVSVPPELGITPQVCVTVLSLQSLSAPAAWIALPAQFTAPALSPLLTALATAAASRAPLAALPALHADKPHEEGLGQAVLRLAAMALAAFKLRWELLLADGAWGKWGWPANRGRGRRGGLPHQEERQHEAEPMPNSMPVMLCLYHSLMTDMQHLVKTRIRLERTARHWCPRTPQWCGPAWPRAPHSSLCR